jgi:hypothetical protein
MDVQGAECEKEDFKESVLCRLVVLVGVEPSGHPTTLLSDLV